MIYRPSPNNGQLYQGEVVSNVVQARLEIESVGQTENVQVSYSIHPYAIVLTQDCDLESDYLRRTGGRPNSPGVPSILFCEVAEAATFRAGVGGDIWRRLTQNKDERYQYLRDVEPEADAIKQGIPALVIDFKRYFSIPTDEVLRRLEIGELRRRACLESPYREQLATRLFYFQFRVALIEEHLRA